MNDPDARLREMVDRLKGRSFRLTPQRLAVLRILAYSEDHPSVDRIYDRVREEFPMTSLATVYKTVTLLKELDEVMELGFSEGSNRYDGNNPYPHPHVICTRCKRIMDPNLSGLNELTGEVEQNTGFQILNQRLDFFGICPDCQGETRPD